LVTQAITFISFCMILALNLTVYTIIQGGHDRDGIVARVNILPFNGR